PLLALVALVLLMGVTWSLVTPAFQAPDENSHFGYVQELAEAGRLPGQAGKPLFSTEQVTGAVASNADQAAAQRQTRMEWDAQVYSQWQRVEHSLPKGARTDGGGPNPA